MKLPMYVIIATLFFVIAAATTPVLAGDTLRLSSSFQYQGQIKVDGVPISQVCRFNFGLWESFDQPSGFLASLEVIEVQVDNGLFDVEIDFGVEVFDGSERWLEVAVACPGPGEIPSFTVLDPRQRIAAVPYALQTRGLLVEESGDVSIGMIGTASRMTVRKGSGRIGVNTPSPLGRLHIVDTSLGLSSAAIREDTLIVEDSNAVLGLYSARGPAVGSVISLKEMNNGSMTDNWTLWRASSVAVGGSSIHLSYGTDPAGTSNPIAMTITPSGDVGVGTTTPISDLHVRGSLGLRVDDAAGEAILSVRGAGNVGIGTDTPTAKLNVESDANLISGPVMQSDDIIVESADAVLGLYSDGEGTSGSAISLKEIHPQGPLTDHWAMHRDTNSAGATLKFSYGTNKDYAANRSVIELTPQPGPDSITLQTDAISAREVLDEPGVARTYVNDFNEITQTTSAVTIASSTINCPTNGYIHAIADVHLFNKTGFRADTVLELARGAQKKRLFQAVIGDVGEDPIIQTVFAASAGAHTVELRISQPQTDRLVSWSTPSITLLYYPTAYGTVDVEN